MKRVIMTVEVTVDIPDDISLEDLYVDKIKVSAIGDYKPECLSNISVTIWDTIDTVEVTEIEIG